MRRKLAVLNHLMWMDIGALASHKALWCRIRHRAAARTGWLKASTDGHSYHFSHPGLEKKELGVHVLQWQKKPGFSGVRFLK